MIEKIGEDFIQIKSYMNEWIDFSYHVSNTEEAAAVLSKAYEWWFSNENDTDMTIKDCLEAAMKEAGIEYKEENNGI